MTGPVGFLTDPWGRVAVTGPDATSFLQALVSQDLEPVGVGEAVDCLLLHPQGKLDVVFRAHRVADGWWCTTEPAAAARLVASLGRFRIRVQVEIVDRTADTARAEVVVADGDPPADLPAVPPDCGVVTVRRRGWVAREVVGDTGPVADWLAGCAVRIGDDSERESRRIAAGIVRQDVDLDDTVIPQEAFLERDAVSFTKGCFLGQELVCRIDARGHVNRFLRCLESADPVAVGDEVLVGGRVVGAVTSAAPHGAGWVALGWVRREVEPPTTVAVATRAGAVDATVRAGPDGSGE